MNLNDRVGFFQKISPDDAQYFTGYYDKCDWNASQTRIMSHRTTIADRMPVGDEAIDVGFFDLDRQGKFEKVGQSRAWSWQQGAMLQWDPAEPESTLLYNDCRDGQFVCVRKNIHTGAEDVLPRPVAAVSRDGKTAMSINYSRLAKERPGYGYEAVPDKFGDRNAPDDDGIYSMDMKTGEARLIISLAQITQIGNAPSMDGVKHWFNHLQFNHDNSRFIFLHRYRQPSRACGYGHLTRLFTAAPDGSNIRCLNDHDMTSHFDWRDAGTVVAWARRFPRTDVYFLFDDKTCVPTPMSPKGVLDKYGDGHCTYCADGKWVLTDTYPNSNKCRVLMIYNVRQDRVTELGEFYSVPWHDPMRCDLHPCFSRDCRQIGIDSSHTGNRGIYVLGLDGITS